MSAAIRGFTLIEVMIVVVIVAFLAAIGFPSYLSHVRKSARAEAKVRLMQVAQLQERYFTEKNTYLADAAPLLGLAAGATIYSNSNNSPSAYQITVTADSTSFTLSAAPQGSQTNDTECGTLVLRHTGKKEISGGTGNATQCWK